MRARLPAVSGFTRVGRGSIKLSGDWSALRVVYYTAASHSLAARSPSRGNQVEHYAGTTYTVRTTVLMLDTHRLMSDIQHVLLLRTTIPDAWASWMKSSSTLRALSPVYLSPQSWVARSSFCFSQIQVARPGVCSMQLQSTFWLLFL